jgi:hypothetical protein
MFTMGYSERNFVLFFSFIMLLRLNLGFPVYLAGTIPLERHLQLFCFSFCPELTSDYDLTTYCSWIVASIVVG